MLVKMHWDLLAYSMEFCKLTLCAKTAVSVKWALRLLEFWAGFVESQQLIVHTTSFGIAEYSFSSAGPRQLKVQS